MRMIAAALTLAFAACATPEPPEARRHFIKAVTYQKEATSPSDFVTAVAEYDEALKIAPGWLDARYNRGVALESLKRYDEAKAAFESYLAGKPSKKDAAEARDRLYALEAKKEMELRKAAGDDDYKEALRRAAERAKTR